MHDVIAIIGHHLLSNGFLDVILLTLGFGAGLIRARGIATFIRISIVIVRMAKWYFATHPHGKHLAENVSADEKLNDIYQKDLAKYDTVGNTFRTGASGEIPA